MKTIKIYKPQALSSSGSKGTASILTPMKSSTAW